MTNYVKLNFKTESGATYALRISNVKDTVADDIPSVMDALIAANTLETDEGNLVSKAGAALYTTNVKPIII